MVTRRGMHSQSDVADGAQPVQHGCLKAVPALEHECGDPDSPAPHPPARKIDYGWRSLAIGTSSVCCTRRSAGRATAVRARWAAAGRRCGPWPSRGSGAPWGAAANPTSIRPCTEGTERARGAYSRGGFLLVLHVERSLMAEEELKCRVAEERGVAKQGACRHHARALLEDVAVRRGLTPCQILEIKGLEHRPSSRVRSM